MRAEPPRTARLELRELVEGDLDALAEVLGDPISMRYYPQPFTREGTLALIQRQRERYTRYGYGLWAVIRREDGAFLGDTGILIQHVEGVDELEVGYHILRTEQRKGYATEAARACIDYAFEQLGRERMIALIRPENLPSRRVAEKLGMRIEKRIDWHGMAHDVHVMRREWMGE